MKPNIGIEEKNRKELVALLNVVLSDQYVLYTKTLNYHWNVEGSSFAELHKFLEGQYREMVETIDETAERVRKLGGIAAGTLKEFTQKTRLKEVPGDRPDAKRMIKNLLTDHEALIVNLRKNVDQADEKYKDKGTADYLTGLMEQHEKMAWMLRSYLGA